MNSNRHLHVVGSEPREPARQPVFLRTLYAGGVTDGSQWLSAKRDTTG